VATILTVCTGNICRSPVAELLLREYLDVHVAVSSAGTHAMVGHGIPAELLMPLDAARVEGRNHEPRQLTESIARGADLIIAMAGDHRTRIVQESPSALRRTFLLDELAKAARASTPLEGDDAESRLASVPDAIQAIRPELAGMAIEDVPDPYRRSQADYDRSFAMIHDAVRDISAWVRG